MITIGTKSGQLLLTPKQACDVLQISARNLWGRTASGEIPSLKIGRLRRYSVDDLNRWIESQKKGGE